MVLDPIPQSLPVHFFGSRPQPPTSPRGAWRSIEKEKYDLNFSASWRTYTYTSLFLGCNHCTGGFRKNLMTFWESCRFFVSSKDWESCRLFFSSKDAPWKVQFKYAIKTMTSLIPCLKNAKWREIFTESTVTSPEQVLTRIFLDIPIVHQQWQICIHGWRHKTCPRINFLHLKYPTRWGKYFVFALE